MKLVGIRKAQAELSSLADRSQQELIVLTRHGRPIAVITGVEGRDLEDIMLSRDPTFLGVMERRARYAGPMVEHAELRAEVAANPARARPPKAKARSPKRATTATARGRRSRRSS